MLILLLIIIAILLLLIYLKMADINPGDLFGEIINTGVVLLLVASPIVILLLIYIVYQNFGDIIDYISSIEEKMPSWMDEPMPDWVSFIIIGLIVYAYASNDDKKTKK